LIRTRASRKITRRVKTAPLKTLLTTRSLRLLWLLALVIFIAVWLYPVSSMATRSAGAVLLCIVWFGLVALAWKRRGLRFGLLGFTALCGIFLALPGRSHPDSASLRAACVAGLRRYEGTRYYWGGESPKGIDCSGLIRRGLIDATFLQGIRTFDPGLVRYSIWLWWHDASARDFGEGHGFTSRLFETPGINVLDQSRILPGDLAVTTTGIHIMAYLGDNRWIEADPGVGHVVIVSAPSKENGWFRIPMNIVRWKIFEQ
jgi:hypothetical protein